jgi:hypothetical protein
VFPVFTPPVAQAESRRAVVRRRRGVRRDSVEGEREKTWRKAESSELSDSRQQ